jgi:hypothetical protein
MQNLVIWTYNFWVLYCIYVVVVGGDLPFVVCSVSLNRSMAKSYPHNRPWRPVGF